MPYPKPRKHSFGMNGPVTIYSPLMNRKWSLMLYQLTHQVEKHHCHATLSFTWFALPLT